MGRCPKDKGVIKVSGFQSFRVSKSEHAAKLTLEGFPNGEMSE